MIGEGGANSGSFSEYGGGGLSSSGDKEMEEGIGEGGREIDRGRGGKWVQLKAMG